MKTLNLGIMLNRGADFSLMVGIFDINGATDLTGYKFLGEIKSSTDPNSAALAEFSFEIQDQFLKKGLVKWYLPISEVDALAASISDPLQQNRLTTPYVFDVKMKDTSGIVSRIIEGIAYLSPDVTEEAFT